MSDVLMVVVSYNGIEHTKVAVDSLRNQTVPVKIVVWDNASKDGTREWLSNQTDIIAHLSDDNVMWTPAINRAIEIYSDSERFIGFMNNDICIPPDGVKRMADVAADPQVALVGPMGSNLGGGQDYGHHWGPWTDIATNLSVLQDKIAQRPPKCHSYILGACVVLRRAVWNDLGPLDENMPLGADDHDYSIRAKRAGYKVMVAQNVFVEHVGHATGSEGEWSEWGKKSWDAFNEKWAGYFTEPEAHMYWSGKCWSECCEESESNG